MRLFIAIGLSTQLREHLVRVQRRLREVAPGVSFTRGENLHLTLKFLGEVSDERVPEVVGALKGMPPGGACTLTCPGLVCFPDRGRIRVIGADVRPDARLMGLVEGIEEALAGWFPKETRRYHPHITLARAREGLAGRRRRALAAAADAAWPAPTQVVRECVVFQSRLHPAGAKHSPIAKLVI